MRNLLLSLALLVGAAGLPACGGASADYGYASTPASPGGMPPMEPAGAAPGAAGGDSDADGILDKSDGFQFSSDELEGKLKDDREGHAKGAPPPAPPPPPGQAQGGAGGQKPAGEAVAVRAPLLIYTAQIGMAVFQVNESLDKVEAIARELGGFLAKRDERSITIRVPVARFDEAVKRLDAVGDVLQRNVAVEDVTAEYVDLEIRLKNARAVRDRLEKLLEKAANVEESVLLEKELGRVAGEIERIEGRLKFLRDRAAFSTITVTFQPRPRESIDPTGPRLPVDWLNNLGLSRLLTL